MKKLFISALLVAAVSACERGNDAPGLDSQIYADALASTTRLEGDYDRDANRKPDEVLEFLGVTPGMNVLDMFSGGGYYSEIISNVVGEQGHVSAHSNEAYLNFVGDEFNARHADGRLSNVDVLWAENNELSLEEGSYDAIMLVLSYHDLYYVDPERGWPEFDVPKLLAELHKGLADDGFVGVIDHYAEVGASTDSGTTVHRIDRAIVIADMEAAGFVVDAESDMLRNLDDDPGKSVFDPAVRGQTDRFILRFRKAD